MPLNIREREFATEQEAVEGTAETMVAADVQTEVEELKGTYANEMNERMPLRPTLSKVALVPGIGVGSITGKVEIVGGGGAAVPPAIVDLLLATGHAQFVVNSIELTGAPTGTYRPGEKITDGGTKVGTFLKMLDADTMLYAAISGAAFAAADTLTGAVSGATSTVHGTPAITAMGFGYRPTSSPVSFTSTANHDGVRRLIYGARATGQIAIEGAGKMPYLNFELQGKATKPTDVAFFTGAAPSTVVPESFLAAGVSAGGDELCIDGFNFDLGVVLARRICANDATGIRSFVITDRKPQIQIAPEAGLEAVKDFWAEYDAGTQFGFTAQCGSTATKRMLCVAPACQWAGLDSGEREQYEVYDAPLRLNGSVDGNDEYMIAFF